MRAVEGALAAVGGGTAVVATQRVGGCVMIECCAPCGAVLQEESSVIRHPVHLHCVLHGLRVSLVSVTWQACPLIPPPLQCLGAVL